MADTVGFLLSFRARLILLLTSILVLTIVVVLVLDRWASKRAAEVIAVEKAQIATAVNSGYGDLAQAMYLANKSLGSEEFLYNSISPGELPRSVERILVTHNDGKVIDSTERRDINRYLKVSEEPISQVVADDPFEHEPAGRPHAPKTYYSPVTTEKGLFWIVIVTAQQDLIDKIEEASTTLATRNRELSNYRLWSSAGPLVLALFLAVFTGWRFTKPIKELANAARQVAAGDLDVRINVNRRDEIGGLANTFNEMIAGLKSKLELEEKLNSSERAAALGRLTQAVAHEIRNPLNVINLSVDHVSTKFAPEDESKRRQFAQILSSLKDEVSRLKQMVNDVLNYGRPAHMSVETIDLQELIEETISLLRPQAAEQNINVTIERDSEPLRIIGDADRLKSCFSNITINALQAMPAGGNLTARVRRSDGFVEVSVTDTGIGINNESLNKVFEPYFSTKKTGFGLGLAVTKKIVDEHRGSIEVLSDPGRGTTFTVRLPAAQP